MKRATRAVLYLVLILVLLAATWLVMSRNRRMSLFLRAKDRLAAGEAPAPVLRDLAVEVDWTAEAPDAAALIAREALGEERSGIPRVHRAGPYALIRAANGEMALAERIRGRWTRVP